MHVSIAPPPRGPLTGIAVIAVVLLALLFGPHPVAAHGVAPANAGSTSDAGFSWPIGPPHEVLRPFQPPRTPYGPGHRGVDLGGFAGEPVLAAGAGLVLYAGPLAGCDLVSVEHPSGLRTTYEPIDPVVIVGQRVDRGQLIGHLLAAMTGCPQEVQAGSMIVLPPVFLYWGVHWGREYLDPLRLVTPERIRLLPWPGDT